MTGPTNKIFKFQIATTALNIKAVDTPVLSAGREEYVKILALPGKGGSDNARIFLWILYFVQMPT